MSHLLLTRLFLMAIIILNFAPASLAADHYVDADGAGQYPTIAAAVAAAAHGDRVLLNPGYFAGPGNNDVLVFRDIEIRESGAPGEVIIDCLGSSSNHHRAFLFEYCDALVRGIIIIGGYADQGGAMLIENGNVTVENCILRYNQAGRGGAIYIFDECRLTMEHTVLDRNIAEMEGGAVYMDEGTNMDFNHNTFILNKSPNGGHLCLSSGASAIGDHILMAFGTQGGAVGLYYGGEITLTCSDVWYNRGGSWYGPLAGQLDQDGNLSVDPELCDPMAYQPNYAPLFTSPIWTLNPCGWLGAVAGDSSYSHAVYGLYPDGNGMFATIQEAMDIVPQHATIMLGDGNYSGEGNHALDPGAKNLILRSRSGIPEHCVIMREAGSATVDEAILYLRSSTHGNTTIADISFSGGSLSGPRGNHGAIVVEGPVDAEIINCRFYNIGTDGDGGGIHLFCESGPVASLKVSGCEFNNIEAHQGGAIWADHWQVDVEDCTFSQISVSNSGGALFITHSTGGEVRDCLIEDIFSSGGGAITMEEGGAGETLLVGVDVVRSSSTLLLSRAVRLINPGNVRFSSCEFLESDGGISSSNISAYSNIPENRVTFEACIFDGTNSSGAGGPGKGLLFNGVELLASECLFRGYVSPEEDSGLGGAVTILGEELTMVECTVELNEAYSGAGVLMSGCLASLTDCVFRNNHALNAGGAIEIYDSEVDVEYCDILNNSAAQGGAIYFGGYFADILESRFERVVIAGNIGSQDGAAIRISANSHRVLLEQCTVFGNELLAPIAEGAQISINGFADLDIYHSLVTGSQSARSVNITGDDQGAFGSYCSNIWGNAGGDWVGHIVSWFDVDENISADPMFCDPENNIFAVHELSPCLPDNNACSTQVGARGQGCSGGVSAVDEIQVPNQVVMQGAYPNPFNPRTTLHYALPASAVVTLTVHDLAGRLVRTLCQGVQQDAGSYEMMWDGMDDRGRAQGSGLYLIRLKAGAVVQHGRMTLVR